MWHKVLVRSILLALLMSLALVSHCFAQEDLEGFRIELTGFYWNLRPSGTVLSNLMSVDLKSDLGISGQKAHFVSKLVLKPGRKHRVLVEVIPYRFNGENTLSREIEFAGRRFVFQDSITSRAVIAHFFGGYQYDFWSGAKGHLGVLGGIGYMDADASAASKTRNLSGTTSAAVPFPLVGAEFRAFPVPGRNILNVNGELKGLSFGSYGRYLDANFNVGIGLGPHFTIQAGYWLVNADVHKSDRSEGIKPNFRGPTISIQVRDR